MTRAIDLVSDALRDLGVFARGQPLDADDAQLGLDRLNTLVDDWAAKNLYAYVVANLAFPVPAGAQSVSIGPGGDIDAPRPNSLEAGVFMLKTNLSYPVQVIDREEYSLIAGKCFAGYVPEVVYYEPTFPVGTLYFYPVMDSPGMLRLPVQTTLSAFADTATDYALPPAYKRALQLSLVEELAAPYSVPITPQMVQRASNARRTLRRNNFEVPMLPTLWDGARDPRPALFGGVGPGLTVSGALGIDGAPVGLDGVAIGFAAPDVLATALMFNNQILGLAA